MDGARDEFAAANPTLGTPEHATGEQMAGQEEGVPFFPNHLLAEMAVVYLVFSLVLILVAFFPFGLEGKADPLNTPEHIKPEWYFLSLYQILKLVPRGVAIVGAGAAMVVLALWPFIDRDLGKNARQRKAVNVLGIVVIALLAGFTFWGMFS
ncbi:MAG: hypothetical protein ACM3TT_01530 [Syntrophothermus sp.]